MNKQQDTKPDSRGIGFLEWLSSGVGLLLTLTLLGILGWQAWRGSDGIPVVTVEVVETHASSGVHVVVVEARNTTPTTAANVTVRGVLVQDGRTIEQSDFTLDYVPGNSVRRGGLFFTVDPETADLEVRALGYIDP